MAGNDKYGKRTKKCYDCGTYLPISAERCTYCKRRVGPPDENGLARKPFNWYGYAVAAAAWAAFGWYIWWAFLRDVG